jgi:uncharacterized Zn-binding protein involved in type VI secretion
MLPGPGSFNVLIGGLPAWRGISAAGLAAMMQQMKEETEAVAKADAEAAAAPPGPGQAALAARATKMHAEMPAKMADIVTSCKGAADIHLCPVAPPPHGPGVVINGSQTVLINGLPACRQTDTILEAMGGPDLIALACQTVIIGG